MKLKPCLTLFDLRGGFNQEPFFSFYLTAQNFGEKIFNIP